MPEVVGNAYQLIDPMSDPFGAIRQSVELNNQWSAEQAEKQMAFQREMSNTAHQREVADLKAAGLNPVLSARLGGASTPAGASATADTSGTSGLVQMLNLAMETANSAAGAAEAAVSGGRSSSLPTDQSAEAVDDPEKETTGEHFGMYQDEDGYWHFGKNEKSTIRAVGDGLMLLTGLLPPGFRGAARGVIGWFKNHPDEAMNAYNAQWTLSEEQAADVEENRRRLAADNAANSSGYYSEWSGAPGYGSHGRHGHH